MAATAVSPSSSSNTSSSSLPKPIRRKWRWALGMVETDEEVPGSVLLLSSKTSEHNAPLGLRNAPSRTSTSSLPTARWDEKDGESRVRAFSPVPAPSDEKKRTADGKIILEPQPDDSKNDPLMWPSIRRDAALLSLGFYCMVGGGMTSVLAAAFTNVAEDYNVTIPKVALTTGFYMLGLGIGGVVFSPTAILYGKRPVYLITSVLFAITAVWCALSPTYVSLLVARIVMGFVISPIECLPSASIAEIFYLHERAYRLGIYTLLLLSGKNLVPLVSAAITQSLSWRWVFWIVAIIVLFCSCLLFFFLPETFWDRTPLPHRHKSHEKRANPFRMLSPRSHHSRQGTPKPVVDGERVQSPDARPDISRAPRTPRSPRHAHFAPEFASDTNLIAEGKDQKTVPAPSHSILLEAPSLAATAPQRGRSLPAPLDLDVEKLREVEITSPVPPTPPLTKGQIYTNQFRFGPTRSYVSTLRPFTGRISQDNWFRVAFRPFILYAYPSVLWAAAVYALSIGWLIVMSETVADIYRDRDTYNFTALQVGLVYVSPFIGGVLGTAIAGKLSDLIVRWMARRNGGIYEPEYRLVMGVPIAIATCIGLMGFGWAAEERDAWIVPTVFFGIISFGCSLGSTTAITFVVDSYRQYAGEALVTLNFSKNILHGFVFSLFFNRWLDADGSKNVFLALGGIQLFFLLWTIPLYMFGKKLRLWTVKRKMMEKF